tara:strand:+ start:276 stop:500 length:225 start_codon:yes stop_codon:yes gene_type:complete
MAGPTKKVGRRVYEKPNTTTGKFIDTKGKYGKSGKTYRTYSELRKSTKAHADKLMKKYKETGDPKFLKQLGIKK